MAVQAFVDPAEEERLQGFVERLRTETDCVVTFGLGPRYLHSTGQLHKGGAPIGCFLQVVDDVGDGADRSPARSSASGGSSRRRLRETTRH